MGKWSKVNRERDDFDGGSGAKEAWNNDRIGDNHLGRRSTTSITLPRREGVSSTGIPDSGFIQGGQT